MKKLFILLAILLFSGCSAEYNLDIIGDNYEEEIVINAPDEIIENFNSQFATTEYQDKYEFDYSSDKATYKYQDVLTNFRKSSAFNKCVSKYSFVSSEENYLLQMQGTFKCYPYQIDDYTVYEYDQVEIKINTNHLVVDNNADKVDGSTYYWYINEENYKDINIKLEFRQNEYKEEEINVIIPIIIGSILLVLIVIVLCIIIKKNKANNKL